MIDFHYQVIRRPRRKTAAITVKHDNTVTVVVPASLSENQIVELLIQKKSWIQKKLYFNDHVRTHHIPKEYLSGEFFSYLGAKYCLEVLQGDSDQITVTGEKLIVQVRDDLPAQETSNAVYRQLSFWYLKHARHYLLEETQNYAQTLGFHPEHIGVKSYKRRWGSCSSRGVINYNWKIIMAPRSIVDYIIIHELCHLQHLNHSKSYWNLVERVMPDYRERKDWLKVHGFQLEL